MRLRDMLARSPCGHVYLDLVEPFRTAPDKDQLYFKTDSHWSGEGCYFAYRLLCERIGLTPEPDLLTRAPVDRRHARHGQQVRSTNL